MKLTCDWLTMMRCRRASSAFSSATAISRCAVPWPWVVDGRARVSCSASTRGRGDPQRGSVQGHHRPFLNCDFFDVATDQGAQLHFGLSREDRGENHDRSQRARFAADRRVSTIVIVPDLNGGEHYEEGEDGTQRRQDAGAIALNDRARSPTASTATTAWIAAATRYVMPKTIAAIHSIGRLNSQSLMFLTLAASVPLPTFASHCSTLECERRKQRDTSKSMVLARISHAIFARSSRFARRFANVFRGVLAGGVRKTRAELGFSWAAGAAKKPVSVGLG